MIDSNLNENEKSKTELQSNSVRMKKVNLGIDEVPEEFIDMMAGFLSDRSSKSWLGALQFFESYTTLHNIKGYAILDVEEEIYNLLMQESIDEGILDLALKITINIGSYFTCAFQSIPIIQRLWILLPNRYVLDAVCAIIRGSVETSQFLISSELSPSLVELVQDSSPETQHASLSIWFSIIRIPEMFSYVQEALKYIFDLGRGTEDGTTRSMVFQFLESMLAEKELIEFFDGNELTHNIFEAAPTYDVPSFISAIRLAKEMINKPNSIEMMEWTGVFDLLKVALSLGGADSVALAKQEAVGFVQGIVLGDGRGPQLIVDAGLFEPLMQQLDDHGNSHIVRMAILRILAFAVSMLDNDGIKLSISTGLDTAFINGLPMTNDKAPLLLAIRMIVDEYILRKNEEKLAEIVENDEFEEELDRIQQDPNEINCVRDLAGILVDVLDSLRE